MTNKDALIKSVWAATHTPDQTPSLVFADYLDEYGIPGGQIVREAAGDRYGIKHKRAYRTVVWRSGFVGPHRVRYTLTSPVQTLDMYGNLRHDEYGEHAPALLTVMHPMDQPEYGVGNERVLHTAPVYSLKHLFSLTRDMDPKTRKGLFAQARPVMPTTDPDSPAKLARTNTKAPAGGAIVNNQVAGGGQFMARAFRSIRETARRAFKLARPGEGRVTLRPHVGEPIMGTDFIHPIHDEQGSKIGHVWVTPTENGTALRINDVAIGGRGTAANTLGPAHVRSALRQLKTFYPNAKRVSGLRVSGAKLANTGGSVQTEAPIKNAGGADGEALAKETLAPLVSFGPTKPVAPSAPEPPSQPNAFERTIGSALSNTINTANQIKENLRPKQKVTESPTVRQPVGTGPDPTQRASVPLAYASPTRPGSTSAEQAATRVADQMRFANDAANKAAHSQPAHAPRTLADLPEPRVNNNPPPSSILPTVPQVPHPGLSKMLPSANELSGRGALPPRAFTAPPASPAPKSAAPAAPPATVRPAPKQRYYDSQGRALNPSKPRPRLGMPSTGGAKTFIGPTQQKLARIVARPDASQRFSAFLRKRNIPGAAIVAESNEAHDSLNMRGHTQETRVPLHPNATAILHTNGPGQPVLTVRHAAPLDHVYHSVPVQDTKHLESLTQDFNPIARSMVFRAFAKHVPGAAPYEPAGAARQVKYQPGMEPPRKLAREPGQIDLGQFYVSGPSSDPYEPGLRFHGIHDSQGNHVGTIKVMPDWLFQGGSNRRLGILGIHRHDMMSPNPARNSFGPGHMRSIMRQLLAYYPTVTTVQTTKSRTPPKDAAAMLNPQVRGIRLPERQTVRNYDAVTRGRPSKNARHDDRVARSPEDNPYQPVMSAPAILAGHDTEPAPLTLGQLKHIEDTHGLPPDKRLSPHVRQSMIGDNHPFSAKVERIAQFFDHLAEARIPQGALKKMLADPHIDSNEKLVHMVSHLGHELKDLRGQSASTGNEWYGEKINDLDRALHRIMTGGQPSALWGTMDDKGELVGKHDPATHHPAMVLFKALIAATSASLNPKDNLQAAFRIWRGGHRLDPKDPIAGLPLFQHDAKDAWFKRLNELWNQQVPLPPDDPRGKAKWFAKWVYPHRAELAGEGKIGYSVLPANILIHDDPNHPHHGTLVRTFNGKKVINDPEGLKTAARTRAKMVLADLPRTDPAGGVKSKGWSVYGAAVARQIQKLQRLVKHFSSPDKTQLQAYRDAANWLLQTHTLDDMAPALKAMGIKQVDPGFVNPKVENIPGSFIFGPKMGPFFLNLHMNDPLTREPYGKYLTADKWWTRMWNRYAGRLLGKKNGLDSINEAPDKVKERRLMLAAARKVAAKAHVTVAALQADLWYYEQQLWRMFGGIGMESYDYADAAKHLPQKLARRKIYSDAGQQHDAMLRAHVASGDDTPLYALADHMEEDGLPGAHLLREGLRARKMGQQLSPAQLGQGRQLLNRKGYDSIGLYGPHTPLTGQYSQAYIEPFHVDGTNWLRVWHHTINRDESGRYSTIHYDVPINDLSHLLHLVSDMPRQTQRQIVSRFRGLLFLRGQKL